MTNDLETTEPIVDETPTDSGKATDGVEIQSPEFQELADSKGDQSASVINRFNEIKIAVSAELGRAEIPIQKLLSLGPGSVLELERSIDSPIELVTQGVPLAKGEVVVVDNCFAIRITEIYPNFKAKQAG